MSFVKHWTPIAFECRIIEAWTEKIFTIKSHATEMCFTPKKYHSLMPNAETLTELTEVQWLNYYHYLNLVQFQWAWLIFSLSFDSLLFVLQITNWHVVSNHTNFRLISSVHSKLLVCIIIMLYHVDKKTHTHNEIIQIPTFVYNFLKTHVCTSYVQKCCTCTV